jgi:hypothetical protein
MTVLASRRESFNAAHQLCDPDLSDQENRCLYRQPIQTTYGVLAAGRRDPTPHPGDPGLAAS